MGIITINGVTFTGNNVNIVNNKVIIDGKEAVIPEAKEISITINGNIESLKSGSGKVTVTGEVETISTGSGDVTILNGDVRTVTTMSGGVKINGNVKGNVTTMSGDVRYNPNSGINLKK
jgi:hypothetical protein